MASSICQQSLALVRRYLITQIRSPIMSAIRILLWPILVTGLYLYVLINFNTKDMLEKGSLESWLTIAIFFTTSFHVYSFSEWLVNDRHTSMKSLMISMGLKRSSYYIANLISFWLFVIPFILAFTTISVTRLFLDSQASSIYLAAIVLLTLVHLTGFCFVVASFITSTRFTSITWLLLAITGTSLVHGLVVWIASRMISLRSVVLFVASAFPYESLNLLVDGYILCGNCDSIKVQDGRINQPPYLIVISLVFWSSLSFAFARWFEDVCPWQADTTVRNPFFCLESSKSNNLEDVLELRQSNKYFEKPMAEREVGVKLRKISKDFKGIPVLDDINLDIYRGETTLLLGHNGAGKTTLMNIILGKMSASTGRVVIKDPSGRDLDSRDGLEVGFCPQESILDENLTVKQHLSLFANVKSSRLTRSQLNAHVSITIDDVGLASHADKLPQELSGGMKRKLSLAMAFVGHSSILILDEPSSGLDPDSRVSVWDAIRRYRADRTVLLSTQHMEEADYLGDRITIMGAGRILCSGSTLFLKNIFGSGYKLRILCPMSKRKAVMEFIKKYFPSAKVSENDQVATPHNLASKTDPLVESVIELSGNHSDDYEARLIELVQAIENHPSDLMIKSHGLRSTSIEDVLLNTSKLLHQDTHQNDKSSSLTLNTIKVHIGCLTDPLRTPSKSVFIDQWLFFRAFFLKNLLNLEKDWFNFILFRVLVPLITAYFAAQSLQHRTSFGTSSRFPVVLVIFFILNPSSELASKFKTMQLTSLANVTIYWIAQLAFDLVSSMITIVAFDIMIVTVPVVTYKSPESLVLFITTIGLILLVISGALISYVSSHLFTNSKTSIAYMFIIFVMSDILISLSTIFRMITKVIDWNLVKTVVRHVFILLMPTETFSYMITGLKTQCYITIPLSDEVCKPEDQFSPVLECLIGFMAQIIIYSYLLYLFEIGTLRPIYPLRRLSLWISSLKNQNSNSHRRVASDPDVLAESEKASSIISDVPRETYSLVANDLNKSYVSRTKVIDRLSFTVERGSCFGLLGVNGAGKTTTFSMIAGEMLPDSGRIWLNGCYRGDEMDKYRNKLGYDPQQNPETSLSPMNALYLMARLRLLKEESIPMLVNSVLELLEMTEHARKSVRDLSGGTKRKLALGMSLIGNTSVLVLDEPTAGVDPFARRNVWQLLGSLRMQSGSSILISSHAMEECEAICDRIAIMAQGRLRCIGSFLHLRSKFGRGCSIKVQFGLANANIANVSGSSSPADNRSLRRSGKSQADQNNRSIHDLEEKLRAKIGSDSFRLVDTTYNSATFDVSDRSVKRSTILKLLREFRKANSHFTYVINDCSLEDIFIALAKEQIEQQLHRPNDVSAL